MADKNHLLLINEGVLPPLFGNLSSSHTALLDQTLDCFTVFAVKNSERFIEATTPRFISSIVSLLSHSDESIVRQAAALIGNHCAKFTERKQTVIDAGVLRHLKVLLMTPTFEFETLDELFTIVYYLADGNQDQKETLFTAGLVEEVIRLINSPNTEIAKCATWAIGTLANGATVQQKQRIIDLQALPVLVKQLTSKDEKLAEFAACGLKDIAESEDDVDIPEIIQAIFAAGAIPPLKRLLISPVTDVSDEALDAFINVTSCNSELCQVVLDDGILPLAKQLLKQPDLDRKKKVMALLENVTRYNLIQVNLVLGASILSDIVKLFDENDPALQKVSLLS